MTNVLIDKKLTWPFLKKNYKKVMFDLNYITVTYAML